MVKLYLPIDIGMETERVKQYTIEMWKDEIEHLGLRTKVYSKRDDDKDGSNRKKRVKKAKVSNFHPENGSKLMIDNRLRRSLELEDCHPMH